jgi:catechol 2,3-dioxygenase-like lactoylglutathione lyase family enzyme
MTPVTHSMKFNHISFPSRDVDATAAFFERFLGCSSARFGTSQILKRHDFDIVIEDASDRPVDWPANFHIGFEVPTAAAVDRLYAEFEEGGAQLATGILRHARGSRFFAAIPGGVHVEINTREDAAEPYRASFGLGTPTSA